MMATVFKLLTRPLIKSVPSNTRHQQTGFTLIETVVTISIVAIAMTGIIAVWSSSAAKGADPFWQTKIETLSTTYLNTIEATPYQDITSTTYSEADFDKLQLQGYQGFTVKIAVDFAGKEFSLAQEQLKKISLTITSPLNKEQQFVTYKGDSN